MVFGKLMTGALTLVVVACILQHYTGLFTDILGVGWGFDPILADEENTFRAVELLGTIAMMLTGAFPMVTLIRRYLGKPLEKLGRLAGLEASGSVGLVACLPNGLAMFPFVKEMRPRDKVVCMAFLACGGYSLGDFLAFNVNFQPNLLVPVFVGQICGGIIGILIGTGGSLLVGRLMFQMTIYPAAWITLCAFTLSVALGILFGIYPAAKAARLQPVEALRAE
mgnify:CR=1 FL=1